MRVDCCDFRPKMTKKTSPVVDVIKLFLEEMQTFKISPITETTRIDHFKSYKTVLQYSFAQKQHSFHIFVQVQTSEQTLFHFLILGKSRFPTNFFYNINYRERERERDRDSVVENNIYKIFNELESQVGEFFPQYKTPNIKCPKWLFIR